MTTPPTGTKLTGDQSVTQAAEEIAEKARSPQNSMAKKHPDGSVQGLSSAAIGLFALLIAFIGYTGFNSSSTGIAWQRVDLLHLVPASIACIFLALVPWQATRQRQENETGKSIEAGRRCFAIGALLTVLAILVFLFRDYLGHHA
jgi:hypothetical protein